MASPLTNARPRRAGQLMRRDLASVQDEATRVHEQIREKDRAESMSLRVAAEPVQDGKADHYNAHVAPEYDPVAVRGQTEPRRIASGDSMSIAPKTSAHIAPMISAAFGFTRSGPEKGPLREEAVTQRLGQLGAQAPLHA